MSKRVFGALLVLALGLAACSSNNQENGAASAEPSGEEAGPPACPLVDTAMAGTPALPTGWPTIKGTTFTGQKKAGPSTILTGYFNDDLDGAFPAYEHSLKGANFTITRDEQDVADAEIDFSGGKSTGEVKMTWPCRGRTDLTITIRPS